MKIGFFSDNYLPMENSGVVVSIARFGKELVKRGHEVHLYAPNVDREEHNGIKIHSCKAVKFNPYPELKLGFPINMDPPKFDIVHAHSPFTLGWYAIKTGLKQNIPKIMTYHTIFEENASYLFSGADKYLKKIVTDYMDFHHKNYNYLIAPSRYMKTQMEHLDIPISIVPTGVDFSEVKIIKDAKKKLGLENKKVYLSLSRIALEKNIDIIISAANTFLDKDSVLLVVGRGPEDVIKKLKSCARHKNIIFTDFVPKKMLSLYYSAADFFITASKSETQGLTTLEAMAHAVPVIGAAAMATPEYVKNNVNGYLFKPDDIKGLADIIKKIPVPEQEMKNEALKTAQEYTMEKCCDLLEDVYEKAIKSYKI